MSSEMVKTKRLTEEDIRVEAQQVYETTASDIETLLIGAGIPSNRIAMTKCIREDGSYWLDVAVDDGEGGFVSVPFIPLGGKNE